MQIVAKSTFHSFLTIFSVDYRGNNQSKRFVQFLFTWCDWLFGIKSSEYLFLPRILRIVDASRSFSEIIILFIFLKWFMSRATFCDGWICYFANEKVNEIFLKEKIFEMKTGDRKRYFKENNLILLYVASKWLQFEWKFRFDCEILLPDDCLLLIINVLCSFPFPENQFLIDIHYNLLKFLGKKFHLKKNFFVGIFWAITACPLDRLRSLK